MKKLMFLFAFVLMISLAQASLENGLVAYYDMNETTGESIDLVDGDNNGVVDAGVIRGAAGFIANASGFDTANTDINYTDHADFDFETTGELTLNFWMNVTSLGSNDWFMYKSGAAGDRFLQLFASDSGNGLHKLDLDIYQSDDTKIDVISPDVNLTTVWSMITIRANATDIALFHNATQVAASSHDGTLKDSTQNWLMGLIGSTNYEYTLDEVGIWNRNLTNTEISGLYRGGQGLGYPFPTNVSFNYAAQTYETVYENFNFTLNTTETTPTAFLWYEGTRSTSSRTDNGDGTFTFQSFFDIPVGQATNTFHWEYVALGERTNTTTQDQVVNTTSLGLCNASLTVPYLNFTFKNETVIQENVTASVPSSNWLYYLGTGTVNKTFTYVEGNEEKSYAFCFIPETETTNLILEFNFENSESQQRTYSPSSLTLSNTTTDTTLWLLPTIDGVLITFQVINFAEQPIEGVDLTISRTGIGTISQTSTGASGTSTVFLNPNFVYTLVASKDGYETVSVTQQFNLATDSAFTIILGQTSAIGDDFTKGVVPTILPNVGSVLMNNTDYNFNATITSSFWEITEMGFTIRNETDDLATTSVSGAGTINSLVNTGNNPIIYMDFYYNIDGNYSNTTYSWNVDRGTREGTLANLFSRISTYASDGLLGLNSFNLAILGFILIFVFVGLVSLKIGISGASGNALLLATMGSLVIIFGYLGFFSDITLIKIVSVIAIIVIAMLFREVTK